MTTLWSSSTELIRRRYPWVIAASLVATIVVAFGIPRLEFKTSQDTLIDPGSTVYKDNLLYQRQFGGEPVLVLFTGEDIRHLFDPPNMEQLASLEDELNESGLYHAVISPLTALRFFRDEIPVATERAGPVLARDQEEAAAAGREAAAAAGAPQAEQERAARDARERAGAAFEQRIAADATRLAAAGEQTLDNPKFVEFLIFDETGNIRPEFQAVFPDQQHALMVIRLNGNMSLDQQGEAATKVVGLVRAHTFDGFDVLPSGPAILLKEINDSMRSSLTTMAVLAVLIMVILLSVVFRARWRLLSLAVVLMATVWAFGLIGFLGIPLTMVTISGLPILIGLGVDFAIQTHSRFEEETERTGDAGLGLRNTIESLGPPLGVAIVGASSGFMVLHISRVPMIRDFGSMLAMGGLIVFLADTLFLGSVLYWRDRRRGPSAVAGPSSRAPVERLVRFLTSSADGRLLPVVALGAVVLVIGLWADTQATVQTDPEHWVPKDSRVLRDLYHIRDTTGSSSELGLMVQADDVTRSDVLRWMAGFEAEELRQHPTELVRSASIASITSSVIRSSAHQEDVEAILPAAPVAFPRAFISDDRTRAHIIFAIGPVSLLQREKLLDEMMANLDAPPGVTVTPSGLAVIGIETVHALSANRTLLIYAALGVKLTWFLIAFRSLVKTALALLPILIAVGASSAAIRLLGIELNPLTSISGPLVIAISVEFSVLIMGRYFEERHRGLGPREAINITSTRIGGAIMASGLTTIGGFGVLAFSGFPLLESFGIVTAMSVGIALLSTLIILPPLLLWADEEARLLRFVESPSLAE